MKKAFFIIIISILTLLSLSLPAAAYTDMAGHWSYPYVTTASNYDLLHGYPDGSFKPDNAVTRGEFVTILAMDSGTAIKKDAQNTSASFPDTKGHWAEAYIAWAAEYQVVSGYDDGRFLPDRSISRQEIVAIMCRYLKNVRQCEFLSIAPDKTFNDEEKIQAWAKESVHTMVRSGIINGRENNLFAPSDNATRGEAATIICKYLNYYPRSQNNYGTGGTSDIYLNGKLLISNVNCADSGNTKLIPVRSVMEKLGYTVKYYAFPGLILLWRESSDTELWINKTLHYTNGIKGDFKTTPLFINGTCFVPIEEVLRSIGFKTEVTSDGDKTVFKIEENRDTLLNSTPEFYGSTEGTSPTGNIRFTLGSSLIYGTLNRGVPSFTAYLHSDGAFSAGRHNGSNLQGAGRMISPTGDFFVGNFDAGLTATGTMYYADGATFSGTWGKGSSSSSVYPVKGTYTSKNGTKYGNSDSEWKGGAFVIK